MSIGPLDTVSWLYCKIEQNEIKQLQPQRTQGRFKLEHF